jgi:hypothetical protein
MIHMKKLMKHHRCKWMMRIAGTLLIVLSAGFAYSQEEPNRIPELNRHVFTYISNIKYPFTNTAFTTNLGFGSANNLSYNIGNINGRPIAGLNGSLTFAHLSFDYQQRVRDWIALYMSGSLTTRLGTNLFSLLSQGVNAVSSFRIGWLIRIAEGEKYALSGTIGLNNSSGTFINLRKFAEDIINRVPNPSITTDVPIMLGDFGLQFAYGFNQVIGLNLDGNVSFGESFDRGDPDLRYALKTAFDFNFIKYRVPLGLVFSGSLVSQPELVYTENGTASIVGVKLSYTGTRDFLLGVEATRMSIPLEDVDQKSHFKVGMISMRYYFN